MAAQLLECAVENLMLLIVLAIHLLLCAMVGKFAASKGRSAVFWFFASILLSALIAWLIVALAPRIGVGANTRCPDCRETVRNDARKCRHCGTELVPQ